MVIIALLSGIALGITMMAILQINRMNETLRDMYRAEDRAIKHFNRLCDIRKIIKDADEKKEAYFVTLDKIKKVV